MKAFSGHTPGPWALSVRESDAPRSGSGTVAVDVTKGDQRIAGITVRPGSRAISNGTLIAAAPDLLEALRELVAVNEEHDRRIAEIIGRPPEWSGSYLDAARAAIAKATGES